MIHLPDLLACLNRNEQRFFFTNRYLDSETEFKLSQKFFVGYLFTVSKFHLQSKFKKGTDQNQIKEKDVLLRDLDNVTNFIKENYYDKFKDYFTEQDIIQMKQNIYPYFESDIVGKIFEKDGQTVSCLLANRYDRHKYLDIPTVHIGYWGYDRNLLNKDEARFIKSRWIANLIQMLHDGDILDGIIMQHNKEYEKFIDTLGGSLVGVRLDPR